MRRLTAIASLLALVAVSCQIETNFGATINADGTGTVIAEIGLDEEAQGFFLEGGSDPFEGNEIAEIPGAETRQEERNGLTYFIVEVPVDDVTQVEDLLTGNENALLSGFDVQVTDTLVSVSGTATAADTLGEQAEGFDPQVFEDSVSANISLTLPGKILSHNADSQDGNTLSWSVPILGGELNIQAESDPTGSPSGGGDGGGAGAIIVPIILVVVAGIGWYVWNRNKNQGSDDAAPAAVTADATPPTDGADDDTGDEPTE